MVKFIGNWMFASHLWKDATPSPIAINIRNISHIDEQEDYELGVHVVVVTQENNQIPIEGDTIEILAAFQKHLSTMY